MEIKAVLTSDLHISASKNPPSSVIPLMALQKRIYDAFFKEVIRMKPDLFIMTGDNTNSGRKEEYAILKEYLTALENHGIRIIMTPGNHDFDIGSEEVYEKMFMDLLRPDERDPHSLSYCVRIHGCTFFAMDDHPSSRSPAGILKPETLMWLQNQLNAAVREGSYPVFLSHHPLHADAWMPRPKIYCLQPSDILPLLLKHDVRLAFSGHVHDAAVHRTENLYEASVPMLLDGANLFGTLTINEQRADYQLHRFEPDDKLLKQEILNTDMKTLDSKREIFRRVLEAHGAKEKINEYVAVLTEWSLFHDCGILDKKSDELLSRPAFQQALALIADDTYGKWIACLCEKGRQPQDHFTVLF